MIEKLNIWTIGGRGLTVTKRNDASRFEFNWQDINDAPDGIAFIMTLTREEATKLAEFILKEHEPEPLKVGDKVLSGSSYFSREIVWVSEDQTSAVTVDSDDGTTNRYSVNNPYDTMEKLRSLRDSYWTNVYWAND